MKKAIMDTGTVESSTLYNNTVEAINTNNNLEYKTSAYQWTVETELEVFTGICKSISEANEEICNVTKENKILKKNITPMPTTENALENLQIVYTWNVTTKKGKTNGTSTNLEEAQSIINSFVKEDVIKSNIIKTLK